MTTASSKNSSIPPPGRRRRWFAPLLIMACAMLLCVQAPKTINSQSVQDYARGVEPIFQEKCAACHNHSVRQGGLNLDNYEALMNGGKHGAVVIPGKSSESRLVKMLEGSVQPRMPVGDSLTSEEVKVIKAWIDAGAPGPGAASGRPINEPSTPNLASKARIPAIIPSSPVKAAVGSLAFHPGGMMVAVGRYQEVELTDFAKRSIIGRLSGHAEQIRALAFSPDGKRLASASADRTVKIWDVATGQRIYTLSDSLDAVNTVAFHPSGKLLAAAGADRAIRVWELGDNDGRQIKSLIAHEDAVNRIIFSPDGKTLATTAADRRIKIWDFSKLEEIYTTELQPDWVFALSFSPDGKRLAIGRYDGSIAFYETATGKNLAGK